MADYEYFSPTTPDGYETLVLSPPDGFYIHRKIVPAGQMSTVVQIPKVVNLVENFRMKFKIEPTEGSTDIGTGLKVFQTSGYPRQMGDGTYIAPLDESFNDWSIGPIDAALAATQGNVDVLFIPCNWVRLDNTQGASAVVMVIEA